MSHMLMRRHEPVPASCHFEAFARGAQFRDRIGLRVKRRPTLHAVSLRDMKRAWLLGEIRYLPARLAGHPQRLDSGRPFLSALTEGATLVLHDDELREIITGSAGRFHRIVDQSPVRFDHRSAFEAFEDPGFEKLFMSVRAIPSDLPGEH